MVYMPRTFPKTVSRAVASPPCDSSSDSEENARPWSENDEKGSNRVLPEAGGDHESHGASIRPA
jgi:hypothetical protein